MRKNRPPVTGEGGNVLGCEFLSVCRGFRNQPCEHRVPVEGTGNEAGDFLYCLADGDAEAGQNAGYLLFTVTAVAADGEGGDAVDDQPHITEEKVGFLCGEAVYPCQRLSHYRAELLYRVGNAAVTVKEKQTVELRLVLCKGDVLHSDAENGTSESSPFFIYSLKSD